MRRGRRRRRCRRPRRPPTPPTHNTGGGRADVRSPPLAAARATVALRLNSPVDATPQTGRPSPSDQMRDVEIDFLTSTSHTGTTATEPRKSGHGRRPITPGTPVRTSASRFRWFRNHANTKAPLAQNTKLSRKAAFYSALNAPTERIEKGVSPVTWTSGHTTQNEASQSNFLHAPTT